MHISRCLTKCLKSKCPVINRHAGYLSELEQKNAQKWETKLSSFKERGPPKLPKWDPAAAKNKEKSEKPEPIEDEDSEDDTYLGGPPPVGEERSESKEEKEDKEEEEEEEDEEEEEEE